MAHHHSDVDKYDEIITTWQVIVAQKVMETLFIDDAKITKSVGASYVVLNT